MTPTAIVTGASGGHRPRHRGASGPRTAFRSSRIMPGTAAKAEEVVKGIEAAGGKAVAVSADIANAAEVKGLFEKAKTAFGEIAVVVNSAGIMEARPDPGGRHRRFRQSHRDQSSRQLSGHERSG